LAIDRQQFHAAQHNRVGTQQ